jgi:hypothetical protein
MKFNSKNCKGLFARGTADNCPPNYVLQTDNFISKRGNLIPRPGLLKYGAIRNMATVSHISIYQPNPIAGVLNQKVMVQNGQFIFNLTDLPGAPISGGSTGAYHSWINFFGRGYYTHHDTKIATGGINTQVYEGGATGRDAAGLKPVSAMLSVLSGGAGLLGVGTYLFDVVYVTSTGFITKPSGNVKRVDSFGTGKVDHTVIPTGPAGIVARRIIMTKAIPLATYTGNPNDYEFFFEPSGLINDNVTTIHSSTEYDGNLTASADYLNDQLEVLPSALGIGEYNSRMLLWGENANPSAIRVSKAADPESFDAIDGLIIVDPVESGGVTNCIALRGTLYIFKNNKMYYTIDNGREPSTWEVKVFDAGTGTGCYGISAVLDIRGTHLNQYLIAARSGLVLFDGLIRTPDLTYWIEDIWRDILQSAFGKVEVLMNPIDKHIYVVFFRNSGIGYILVGDYSDGLDADNIKWFIWDPTIFITTGFVAMVIQLDADNIPVITISDYIGLYTISISNPKDTDDNATGTSAAFDCTLKSPIIVNSDDDSNLEQINTVRIRQKGGDNTSFTVQGLSNSDSAKVGVVTTVPFVSAPTKIQDRWIYYPWVDDEPVIKIVGKSSPTFTLSRVTIEGDVYGESDPQ